jgi:hypothetical protein
MSDFLRNSCVALLVLFAHSARARPAEIILLRHAEKPADTRIPDLSPRGAERAQALARLLAVWPDGHPVAIFAARPTAHAPSRRSIETIEPTARELHLPVQTTYSATQLAQLASELTINHAYDDRLVVVCWVHDELPALAQALGVKKAPVWNGKTFDRLWCIQYANGKATLKNLPQRLLPGDS